LIIMSQSRTGWVLTLIALFLSAALWLLQKMPPKQGLLAVLVAVPMAAAGMYAIYLLAPTILASVGKDSTLSQRTIIWAAAWDAALKHPFLGYGFAAFWKGLYGPSQSIVLIAGWGLQQAQNGFLDVWLGMGIVGLFVVAAMTLQSMRNAIRSFHSCNHQAYVRWCIVVIVTTLLYNIGESSIGFINLSWFFFLLAIIGLSQTARERYEPDRYVI
jgi:exopolysaccharide production protein ExoQ